MALLTGYQLQRFGTERLIPGLVPLLLPVNWTLPHRDYGRCTHRRRVYGGTGHDAGQRGSRAIEAMGIGPLRFLAAPRMLALFSADAVSLHGFKPCKPYSRAAWFVKRISASHFRIFSIWVKDSLLIRDIITGIEELHVRLAHRLDRLLPGT